MFAVSLNKKKNSFLTMPEHPDEKKNNISMLSEHSGKKNLNN